MSFDDHIDKVNNAKEPAPAYKQEQKEYEEMLGALRSEPNRKSYQAFAHPVHAGDKQ